MKCTGVKPEAVDTGRIFESVIDVFLLFVDVTIHKNPDIIQIVQRPSAKQNVFASGR